MKTVSVHQSQNTQEKIRAFELRNNIPFGDGELERFQNMGGMRRILFCLSIFGAVEWQVDGKLNSVVMTVRMLRSSTMVNMPLFGQIRGVDTCCPVL